MLQQKSERLRNDIQPIVICTCWQSNK